MFDFFKKYCIIQHHLLQCIVEPYMIKKEIRIYLYLYAIGMLCSSPAWTHSTHPNQKKFTPKKSPPSTYPKNSRLFRKKLPPPLIPAPWYTHVFPNWAQKGIQAHWKKVLGVGILGAVGTALYLTRTLWMPSNSFSPYDDTNNPHKDNPCNPDNPWHEESSDASAEYKARYPHLKNMKISTVQREGHDFVRIAFEEQGKGQVLQMSVQDITPDNPLGISGLADIDFEANLHELDDSFDIERGWQKLKKEIEKNNAPAESYEEYSDRMKILHEKTDERREQKQKDKHNPDFKPFAGKIDWLSVTSPSISPEGQILQWLLPDGSKIQSRYTLGNNGRLVGEDEISLYLSKDNYPVTANINLHMEEKNTFLVNVNSSVIQDLSIPNKLQIGSTVHDGYAHGPDVCHNPINVSTPQEGKILWSYTPPLNLYENHPNFSATKELGIILQHPRATIRFTICGNPTNAQIKKYYPVTLCENGGIQFYKYSAFEDGPVFLTANKRGQKLSLTDREINLGYE